MKVLSKVRELQTSMCKLQLSPIALVPTMGALHAGHISLVESAVEQSPLVVVSIFVNPTQFNDKTDLKNYPRNLESDLLLLGSVLRENDMVFTPSEKEIYPDEDLQQFNFGNLDKVMEAKLRPGHFNGVAQVVSRLFDIVKPNIAMFGMKDFQQVAVIKELVKQTQWKPLIKGMPIIRENDGLAMSSRNQLLEPKIRKNASVIYKTLTAASEMLKTSDIPDIKSFVEKTISSIQGFELQYFDIVDDKELIPLETKSEMIKKKQYYGCIAVKAGKIRLIDNIEIRLV